MPVTRPGQAAIVRDGSELLLGTGTPYTIRAVEDGAGFAEVRHDERDRPLDDGAYVDGGYLPARTVVLQLGYADGPGQPLSTLRGPLGRALRPVRGPDRTIDLVWWRHGDPAPTVQHVRPSRFDYGTADPWTAEGAEYRAVAELLVPTPYRFGLDVRSVELTPDEGDVGGRTYPRDYPLSYGGGAIGLGTAHVAGDADTWPTFVIHGPITRPSLEHLDTGRAVTFDLQLGVGQRLEVDPRTREVLLNGASSRFGSVTASSRWWRLSPGTNTLRLSAATSGDGARAVVSWRDAYL